MSGFSLFLVVVGGAVVSAVAVVAVGLALLWVREFVYAWWMIVRARAIIRRQGGDTSGKPVTLGEWLRSIWKVATFSGELQTPGGVIVPRSPFAKLRHA